MPLFLKLSQQIDGQSLSKGQMLTKNSGKFEWSKSYSSALLSGKNGNSDMRLIRGPIDVLKEVKDPIPHGKESIISTVIQVIGSTEFEYVLMIGIFSF